jgi:hypothetical protein
MSDLSVPTATDLPQSYSGWPRQLVLVLAMVALADWMFYGHAIGISALVFLLALDIGVVLANPLRAGRREMLVAFGVLVAAFAPLAVETSVLSVLFGALGAAYFARATTRRAQDWTDRLRDCFALLLDGTWQAVADIFRAGLSWSNGDEGTRRLGSLAVWVVPVALGTIFLLLFTAANPLIEEWFASFDFRSQAGKISFARVGFWLAALSLTWPFIFMRARSALRDHAAAEVRTLAGEVAKDDSSPSLLFSDGAILRSLIVFNALFAVQTLLDLTYLWGGVALPDGMTYAAYAHRGAYPLIVTALLAAGFVIMTMRPGSDTERSALIRTLVYLWIAQNVLLVISSILRLDLYVAFYSLTYWRIAAFVWMLLVAAGLVLIVARIVLGRSNGWLVKMNFGSAALALYVCCFFNFPQLIADYNVEHSRELSKTGVTLDTEYLVGLGPQAIPALDRFLAFPEHRAVSTAQLTRGELAVSHRLRAQDWRSWTYRNWQLTRYLSKRDEAGRPQSGSAPDCGSQRTLPCIDGRTGLL